MGAADASITINPVVFPQQAQPKPWHVLSNVKPDFGENDNSIGNSNTAEVKNRLKNVIAGTFETGLEALRARLLPEKKEENPSPQQVFITSDKGADSGSKATLIPGVDQKTLLLILAVIGVFVFIKASKGHGI